MVGQECVVGCIPGFVPIGTVRDEPTVLPAVLCINGTDVGLVGHDARVGIVAGGIASSATIAEEYYAQYACAELVPCRTEAHLRTWKLAADCATIEPGAECEAACADGYVSVRDGVGAQTAGARPHSRGDARKGETR